MRNFLEGPRSAKPRKLRGGSAIPYEREPVALNYSVVSSAEADLKL